jgi:hypothetical protein
VILAVREAARNCALRRPGKRSGRRSVARSRPSHAGLSSLDFQTCRIADSPKSAGREVALEVGLETCAATVRRGDLTHNLSLSLVASCHR